MKKFLSITALAGALFAASPAFAHEPQVGIHIGVPNVIFSAHNYQPYYYQHHHYNHVRQHYRHHAHQHWRHHDADRYHRQHWNDRRGDQHRDGYGHGR